ncbi:MULTISPECIES: serine/threonine protein kinase [Desulfosediminicola]|uniref:serine/threonine protein kinase n=1 Tax=Desulfosediminicola TaxID=2886823 RepID=UPI0010ABF210|nr:serine/threonine-protein kinase [Desulfosediminicola ganghwensis]
MITNKRVLQIKGGTYTPQPSNWITTARIVGVSLFVLSLLAGIGYWTSHAVREAIVNVYAANLTTILDADVEALDIWVHNEMSFARSHAQDPLIARETMGLIEIHQKQPGDTDKLINSESFKTLQKHTLPILEEKEYWGYFIVDRAGYVLAASIPVPFTGLTINPEMAETVARVFNGETIVSKPQLSGIYLPEIQLNQSQPIMLSSTPILAADGTIIAALALALNPDKDFTRILSVARMGDSGDTYAFDKNGFLISDSRFEDQLREIGLLRDLPDVRSILAIQIRDPGGNMTKGFTPELPIEELPLTRMAASAVAGNSGVNVKGYRDYRGVEVIGAWRWLDEYGFGVATEIPKSDAFKGHRPVIIAFFGLFSLVIISCLWFLYSARSIQRLQSKIDSFQQLGQYRLIKKIGEGGMGKVYQARHALLKRPTAVKFLKPDAMDDETVERFKQEVQLTASLSHPNTVQIYDYGKTEEGIFYYAMEYLNGINLAQLLEIEGKVPLERVIYIIKHVCYSLEEAHKIGLIHRDIKPMNIMLCMRGGRYDSLKVLDFGLAKELNRQSDLTLTTRQGIIGTPAYIAPERLKGTREIDIRSDFYSLGSVAYNLLSGKDVFDTESPVEICYHIINTEAPSLSERLDYEIPAEFEQLIATCLAKNPDERPANAAAIIAALKSLEEKYCWSEDDARQWWQANEKRINELLPPG